jgi:hypothetical protein
VDNNNNITANAQGLILSDKAAGIIIAKNFHLSDDILLTCGVSISQLRLDLIAKALGFKV